MNDTAVVVGCGHDRPEKTAGPEGGAPVRLRAHRGGRRLHPRNWGAGGEPGGHLIALNSGAKVDVAEEILRLTRRRRGVDHAFEAVGLAATVALAILCFRAQRAAR